MIGDWEAWAIAQAEQAQHDDDPVLYMAAALRTLARILDSAQEQLADPR